MTTLLLALLCAVPAASPAPEPPARQPQLAADRSSAVLTYGAGKTIYFRALNAHGELALAPVKVAAVGVLPLGRHRGPRIAIADRALVITAVAGNSVAAGPHAHGLPADGDLLFWRSVDGGATWSAGGAINDAPGSAEEGLHALASDGVHTLYAVWLDHRGGSGTRLYAARSTDGGATWSKNFLVYQSPDGTICQCCHPTAVAGPSGQLFVMWRNSLGGARDMYLAVSRDGTTFAPAEKLGRDSWKLDACPMDGGGLAVSAEKVVSAWRREDGIYLAAPGEPERRIGTGKDVAVALSGDREYAVWVNGTKIEAWIGGTLQTLSRQGAFPTLRSLPRGGVLAAWEENGAIAMRLLP